MLSIIAYSMRILAISDIHGCARTFRTMVEDRLKLTKEDQLVLCGDFVDRGPDTKGVIDYIFALQAQGFQVHTLKGNHEAFLLHAIDGDVENSANWLYYGGKQTLESYGCRYVSQLPARHLNFYKELKLVVEIDQYIFVHAGVGIGSRPPLEDAQAILWSRNWYPDLDYDWLGDRYIIHGHTPIPEHEIKTLFDAFEQDRVMNIDAGCVYKNPARHLGKLCAFDLTNRELYFQHNID
ncbi:MAG: metallophosphoesterase family protein [Bacteroidia bacterium]